MSAAPKPYPPTAYSLFLRGMDTAEIAKKLGLPEHEVYHDLTAQRSRAKGVEARFEPSPYREITKMPWFGRVAA